MSREWIATCNSYSDRLYQKGEVVSFVGEPPSPHFKPVDKEHPKVSDEPPMPDIIPLSYAGMDRDGLYALAVERKLEPHQRLGRDKLIALLVEEDKKKGV